MNKEQYDQLKHLSNQTLGSHILSNRAIQAYDLIESLRAVARRASCVLGEHIPDSPAFLELCQALDAVPAWCLECELCDGAREVDSGGFDPQGHGINIPCQCQVKE